MGESEWVGSLFGHVPRRARARVCVCVCVCVRGSVTQDLPASHNFVGPFALGQNLQRVVVRPERDAHMSSSERHDHFFVVRFLIITIYYY